jgi:hypothetical protein
MALIVLSAYMIQFPMGGMLSSRLQWLVGLKRLGHDVYIFEKARHKGSCFDPSNNTMTDDCAYGLSVVNNLLARFGLENKWSFVDSLGIYHGLSQEQVIAIFKSADLFVGGVNEPWIDEAWYARRRVLVDGDPPFDQISLVRKLNSGIQLPYDYYYSVGRNVGTIKSSVPTAGIEWRHIFHPVIPDLFSVKNVDANAPFTTVMNWQSFKTMEFDGISYGHKNSEFMKFIELPKMTNSPIEIAVAGAHVPTATLIEAGWRIRNAHAITKSFDSFLDYIWSSRGEFSVCKQGYVVTNSGWFGDRSGAYLASGRPVVLEETGFSEHLPCGQGLFAVRCAEEAAAAIEEIVGNYERHSRVAREIACDYLNADNVLGQFLGDIGV